MSADNWAQCPRCEVRGRAELEARETKIRESYGKIPVEQFDADRAALEQDRSDFEKRMPAFREDYEIYGAESGSVTVSYRGKCRDCGLTLQFKEDHPIPDWNVS